MTVFAIDPGPHTAIVWRSDDRFRAVTLDFTIASPVPSHLDLFNWLGMYSDPKVDTVVVESFEFRKDERNREYINYDAGEYVGVVKLWCQLRNCYYVVQNAAKAKQFWSDDKLKRVGTYRGLKDRHQRDAMRHWLHYDTFTQNNQEWLYMLKEG